MDIHTYGVLSLCFPRQVRFTEIFIFTDLINELDLASVNELEADEKAEVWKTMPYCHGLTALIVRLSKVMVSDSKL